MYTYIIFDVSRKAVEAANELDSYTLNTIAGRGPVEPRDKMVRITLLVVPKVLAARELGWNGISNAAHRVVWPDAKEIDGIGNDSEGRGIDVVGLGRNDTGTGKTAVVTERHRGNPVRMGVVLVFESGENVQR